MSSQKIDKVVLEISEVFPSDSASVKGLFVKSHIEALKKYCPVIVVVPLRMVPPRSIFRPNPFATVRNVISWWKKTGKVRREQLGENTLYLRYVSLPRPWFEAFNIRINRALLANKIVRRLTGMEVAAVYCHWGLSFGYTALRVSQKLNVPLLLDIHEDPDNVFRYFPLTKHIYKKVLLESSLLIAHSGMNAKKIEALGIDKAKIRVVPLGLSNEFMVNSSKYQKRRDFSNCFTVIDIAGLQDPCKNVNLLIRCVSDMKKEGYGIRLKIIGDGTLRGSLEAQARDLGITGSVNFMGNLSPEKVRSNLATSDLFVFPSVRESFGIALMEAIACGIPSIAAENVGAVSELRDRGVVIDTFEGNSVLSMKRAIVDILNNYREGKRIAVRNSKIVRNSYSWESHARDVYQIINELSTHALVI